MEDMHVDPLRMYNKTVRVYYRRYYELNKICFKSEKVLNRFPIVHAIIGHCKNTLCPSYAPVYYSSDTS